MDEKAIKTCRGLYKQIETMGIWDYMHWGKRDTLRLKIIDVGDYSICVAGDLTKYNSVCIKLSRNLRLDSDSILPSSEVSVIYFSDKVSSIFKIGDFYNMDFYRPLEYEDIKTYMDQFLPSRRGGSKSSKK